MLHCSYQTLSKLCTKAILVFWVPILSWTSFYKNQIRFYITQKRFYIYKVKVQLFIVFFFISFYKNILKIKIDMMEQEHPLTVQDTNEQALASKISAIRKGYIKDNYAQQFAKFKGKRDIIMHRGYWARVYIVRKLVQTMIKCGEDVQIIALGAGLQTLWFNLQEQGELKNNYTFIQLDLTSVVKRKIKKIEHSKKISTLLHSHNMKLEIEQNYSALICGQKYKLAGCDLSDLNEFKSVMQKLNINPKRPTLFYAECVLSYIDADKVDDLLKFIQKQFSFAYLFDYQMYDPADRFGQMMVKNFNRMGCPLVGIYKYPNLKDQNTRFQNCGFKSTECLTMARLYYDSIEAEERKRIQKIQFLDQLQEWNLIMGHYFGLLSVTYQGSLEQNQHYTKFLQQMKLKK